MRCVGIFSSIMRMRKTFFISSGLVMACIVYFTAQHVNVYDANLNAWSPFGESGVERRDTGSGRNASRDEPVSLHQDSLDDHPSPGLKSVNQSRESQGDHSSEAQGNSPIDIEERVPSIDELYDRIAIVSAFSQNHYKEALAFIASAQQTMPGKPIIIYDLGIDKATLPKVRKYCGVEVRPFPFSSYPSHVKNLHNYAWKPILIDITLREFGAIFWGDSSVRFLDSLRELMPYSTRHHGFMSHWHSFDPKVKAAIKHQYFFTNPKMFTELGVDRQMYYNSKNLAAYPAANRQLYINSSVIQRKVVQPMLECALTLRCIAPDGSKVGTHRFDASLLAILVYKNMKGEWTPQVNDNDAFDRVIDIQRSQKGGDAVKTCERR